MSLISMQLVSVTRASAQSQDVASHQAQPQSSSDFNTAGKPTIPPPLVLISSDASQSRPLKPGQHRSHDFEVAIRRLHQWLISQKFKKVQNLTAQIMGISRQTVRRVLQDTKRSQPKVLKRGWKNVLDKFTLERIQKIVHSFFHQGHAPTISEIYDKVRTDLKEDFGDGKSVFCARTLLRVLRHLNFRYKKRKSRDSLLFERSHIIDLRHHFLRQISQYRSEERPICYIDETWATSNMGPDKVWVDVAVEKNPREARTLGSGISLNLSGSQGAGQRVIIESAVIEEGGSCRKLDGADLILKSGGSHKDYHKDMNSDTQENYFRSQLIPSLPAHSVIVLDNAPYHNRKLNKVPTMNSRKAEIIKYILDNRAVFPNAVESDLNKFKKTELLAQLTPKRSQLEERALDKLICDANKDLKILRLPPYHCELNPIEKLWADLKRYIRSHFNAKQTYGKLQQVLDLTKVFLNKPDLTNKNLQSYFKYAKDREAFFWEIDGLMSERVAELCIDLNSDSDSDSDCSVEF